MLVGIVRFFTWGQVENVRAVGRFTRDAALWYTNRLPAVPRLPRDEFWSFLTWLALLWLAIMLIALHEERRLWLAANPVTAAYVRGLRLRRPYPWWSPFAVDYHLVGPALDGWTVFLHGLVFRPGLAGLLRAVRVAVPDAVLRVEDRLLRCLWAVPGAVLRFEDRLQRYLWAVREWWGAWREAPVWSAVWGLGQWAVFLTWGAVLRGLWLLQSGFASVRWIVQWYWRSMVEPVWSAVRRLGQWAGFLAWDAILRGLLVLRSVFAPVLSAVWRVLQVPLAPVWSAALWLWNWYAFLVWGAILRGSWIVEGVARLLWYLGAETWSYLVSFWKLVAVAFNWAKTMPDREIPLLQAKASEVVAGRPTVPAPPWNAAAAPAGAGDGGLA